MALAVLAGVSIPAGLWRAGRPGSTAKARRILYYQDSMHPWIKSSQPGKCTICDMDLTPIYEGDKPMDAGGERISLSSNAVTVVNVQTDSVKCQPLVRTLQVAGTLEANESKKTIISAPAPGRIEDLAVEYAGVEVHENQRLLTFFSPELTQERRRYVVRARLSDQRDPTGGLAVPRGDADPYYSDLVAPHSGTVIERKVTRGQFVSEGERLFTIADASVLWYRFDVYEQQLSWVRPGQKVQVRVPSIPGKVFSAVISFLDPMLNEATRTVKVRADIQNPLVEIDGKKERLLRFGMFAEGTVLAESATTLTVPRSAVLYTGHSACAYVEREPGAYERRRVKLGREGNDSWEILGGLAPGDRVVTSGAVLLDAQAQFNQASVELIADGAPDADSPGLMAASVPLVSDSAMPPEEMTHHPMAQPAKTPQPGLAVAAPKMTNNPMNKSVEHQAKITESLKAPVRPIPRQRAYTRQPAAESMDGPHGGRVGGKIMMEDLAFERLREVRSSELAETPPDTNAPPKFSQGQSQSLQDFLSGADAIAQALSADSLDQFNQQTASLSNKIAMLQKEFVVGDRWKGEVHHFLGAAKWAPARDLAEARAQFLPFTINVVALVKELKNESPAFASVKIYHCPMAPKPGLWIQSKGPLANPFFGAKMLRCGEEVQAEEGLAVRQVSTRDGSQ